MSGGEIAIEDYKKTVLAWKARMNKVEVSLEKNYMDRNFVVHIKDTMTGHTYNFKSNIGWGEKEDLNILVNQLSETEDKIYTERGKHLSKSYSFYEHSTAKPYVPKTADGKTSFDTTPWASTPWTLGDGPTEEDVELAVENYKKKKLAEELMEKARLLEIEAKEKAEAEERKKAYDGNSEFGTF